jgi:hypothetical protein
LSNKKILQSSISVIEDCNSKIYSNPEYVAGTAAVAMRSAMRAGSFWFFEARLFFLIDQEAFNG